MSKKLTLYVDELLIKQMKVQAVHSDKSLSEITESLYREFLKRSKAKK